jgi:fumarate reductase flavoprotein subunit
MKPVVKAPFYAGNSARADTARLAAIKSNQKAEVLGQRLEAGTGLFAAGTDTCAIYGDSYMFLLPGNTMGYCLNTGRFAGESAAEYAVQN